MAAEVFDGVLWTLALTVSPAFEPMSDGERAKFSKKVDQALKSARFKRFTQSLEKTAPVVTLFVAFVAVLGPRLLLALEARKHNAANATRRGKPDTDGQGPGGNVHGHTRPPETPGPNAGPSGGNNGRAPNIREAFGVIDSPPIRPPV